MNSPQFPTDSLNIPQDILDHYHAHYNNTTYRAFSDALAASLPGGEAHCKSSELLGHLGGDVRRYLPSINSVRSSGRTGK